MMRRLLQLSFIWLALALGPANAAIHGSAAVTINVTKTTLSPSCVAYCGVLFDATATTSTETSFPIHELAYYWDFGDTDPQNVNWTYGSYNSVDTCGAAALSASQLTGCSVALTYPRRNSLGPYVGHVYKTAGTYTVTLTVTGRSGDAPVYTTTVVVADPDTSASIYAGNWTGSTCNFGGANGSPATSIGCTVCLTATTYTGCPASGGQNPKSAALDWQTIVTNYLSSGANNGDGLRILLHDGDTFSTSGTGAVNITCSNCVLGSFGSGAQPIIQAAALLSGGSMMTIGDGTSNTSAVTIHNVQIDGGIVTGTTSMTNGCMTFSQNASKTLITDVTCTNAASFVIGSTPTNNSAFIHDIIIQNISGQGLDAFSWWRAANTSINGNVMTVGTAPSLGVVSVGSTVSNGGSPIPSNITVQAYGTGGTTGTGGTGTYQLSSGLTGTVAATGSSYNSGTGVVVLNLTAATSIPAGATIVVSGLTGTGSVASLDGTFTVTATAPTQLQYTASTGLGAITITGGSLVVSVPSTTFTGAAINSGGSVEMSFFRGLQRFSFLGWDFENADSSFQMLRLQNWQKGELGLSYFQRNPQGFQAFTLRGDTSGSKLTDAIFNRHNNVFIPNTDPTYPSTTFTEIRPQTTDGPVLDVIDDGNYCAAGKNSNQCFQISDASNVSVRNGVLSLANRNAVASGIGLLGEWLSASFPSNQPNNIWIYNNTIYCGTGAFPSAYLLTFAPGSSFVPGGTMMKNDLFYCPNATTVAMFLDSSPSSSIVTAANSDVAAGGGIKTDPKFTVGTPVNVTDYRLQGGSYALGAGTTAPVYRSISWGKMTGSIGALQ